VRPRYAGIGSRKAPYDVWIQCTTIASRLETIGFVLRSGGASGPDQAFEDGVLDPERKEILRPEHATEAAMAMAAKIHPAWGQLGLYVRQLHARNVQIVLGEDLKTPVKFVVCWTPDAKPVGGTRTGIVLAESLKIPVYNLADPVQNRFLMERLERVSK